MAMVTYGGFNDMNFGHDPRDHVYGGINYNYPREDPREKRINEMIDDLIEGPSIRELQNLKGLLNEVEKSYTNLKELVEKLEHIESNPAAALINARRDYSEEDKYGFKEMFKHSAAKSIYKNAGDFTISRRETEDFLKHFANKVLAEEKRKRRLRDK